VSARPRAERPPSPCAERGAGRGVRSAPPPRRATSWPAATRPRAAPPSRRRRLPPLPLPAEPAARRRSGLGGTPRPRRAAAGRPQSRGGRPAEHAETRARKRDGRRRRSGPALRRPNQRPTRRPTRPPPAAAAPLARPTHNIGLGSTLQRLGESNISRHAAPPHIHGTCMPARSQAADRSAARAPPLSSERVLCSAASGAAG
jgi:hypothetical protein